jgi:hypothetical protein
MPSFTTQMSASSLRCLKSAGVEYTTLSVTLLGSCQASDGCASPM